MADTGGVEIFIRELFKLVVHRRLVALAPFLMPPQPPTLAVQKVVLDLHCGDGAGRI